MREMALEGEQENDLNAVCWESREMWNMERKEEKGRRRRRRVRERQRYGLNLPLSRLAQQPPLPTLCE